MCHCFDSIGYLSDEERERILAEHSVDELEAEYSPEELESLGISPA